MSEKPILVPRPATQPIVTIRTAKLAWEILKKANLHHFLDSGALYAIQKISEINLSLSDIVSDLLSNGVLEEFLVAITQSDLYTDAEGASMRWDSVPLPIIGDLISGFFSAFTATFKRLLAS